MDSATEIKEIATGKDNCRVYGRLIRLWDSRNMSSTSQDSLISIDGIILDESGNKAQITVPKKLDKQFSKLLDEGYVYMITDVTAVPKKNKTYMYHLQDYVLQFKSTTKMHPLISRGKNIPRYSFEFCSFDDLPSKRITTKPLIDLIGVISNVGPYDYAGRTSTKKMRRIQIKNLDEQTEDIILWGNHGEHFDVDTVLKKSEEGIVVAIFAGLTAGSHSGKDQVVSCSATKVHIELDLPEVSKYHISYQWDKPTLQRCVPQGKRLTPIEAAGQLYKLEQISAMPMSSFEQGATFSCIAKVTNIIPSAKWYYIVCAWCTTGYNSKSDTPRCTCQASFPKPLYKLPLTITDDTSTMDAIAFTFVATELVGSTATQASQNMKIDSNTHAPALDKVIGKTRLFNIGMNTTSSSRFSINYVLRRSFQIDDTIPSSQPQNEQPSNNKDLASKPIDPTKDSSSQIEHTPLGTPTNSATTDFAIEKSSSSTHNISTTDIQPSDTNTRRALQFNEEVLPNIPRSANKPDNTQEELEQASKRQKQSQTETIMPKES